MEVTVLEVIARATTSSAVFLALPSRSSEERIPSTFGGTGGSSRLAVPSRCQALLELQDPKEGVPQ